MMVVGSLVNCGMKSGLRFGIVQIANSGQKVSLWLSARAFSLHRLMKMLVQ